MLFFETLNCKRSDDLFNYDNTKFINKPENDLVKIPYLNGGLFEEENIKHRELIVDAELFRSLFDFFNQYNFTIYEDDPNDHTVAVDPEMLGHIFENLLEDNKDKGAFYTPKEIVHYMCQESLIEYLCTTLKIEDEAKEREAITNLLKKKEIDEILKPEIQNINQALDAVKICDPAIGSGAFPMGLLHEIFTAKQTLYAFEAGNSIGFDASGTKLNIIQNSIYGVDIEKGAVDIARLRFWLSLIVDESEPKPLPNLDYKIVVGNSLVSKFGDDILEIDWNLNATAQENIFGSSDIRDEKAKIIKQIIKEQKEFFNPTGDKKTLAADVRNLKIDLLINQLQLMAKTKGLSKIADGLKGKAHKEATELFLQTNSWKQSIAELTKLKTQPGKALEFFDWKLDFPEIMNENVNPNTGFDIVIGNPPYGGEKISKELQSKLALGSNDVYSAFIAKSYCSDKVKPFAKAEGVLCFIVSDTFMTIKSHKQLRQQMLKYQIKKMIRVHPDTFKATVNTAIILCKRTTTESREDNYCMMADFTNISIHENHSKFIEILTKTSDSNFNEGSFKKVTNGYQISNSEYAIYVYPQSLINTNSNQPFFVASPKLFAFMDDSETVKTKKIEINGQTVTARSIQINDKEIKVVKLGEIADVKVGLQTGDNNAYLFQNPNARGTYRSIEDYREFLLSEEDLVRIRNNDKLRLEIIQ